MKDILQLVVDLCNNNGSYIPLAELEMIWNRQPLARHESFANQLQMLISAGAIHLEGDRVYLERVWCQEQFSAQLLSALLSAPSLPELTLSNPIRVGGITLTDEQRNAVAICLNHRISLILAKAGSGKTTLARAVIENAGTQSFMLCAPTGKAARRLSEATGYPAGTIHRALGARTLADFLNVKPMDDLELILIDEATMVTIDMLGGILRAAPDGCRIVLIGDQGQLPAVGPGDVIDDLVRIGVPSARLTQNHRQNKDAGALCRNVIGFETINWRLSLAEDSSFVCRYSEYEGYLMEALVDDAAARYLRDESVQVLTFRCDDMLEINRRIQQRVNPAEPHKRKLKNSKFVFVDGDRVMLCENDHKQCCYNGETGILRIEETGGFCVEFDDGRCPEWSVFHAPENILPAYAITIHRAQGSEYDSVLMFVPRCSSCLLHRNSFYTGISRAKRQLVLFGNPKAVEFGLHALPPSRLSALVEMTESYNQNAV